MRCEPRRAAARHPARRPRPATFGLEALEPRLLLSADPVLGAVQAVLLPAPGDPALDAAYPGAAAAATLPPGLAAPLSDPPSVLTGNVVDPTGNIVYIHSVRISGAVDIEATLGSIRLGNESTDYVGGNSAATTDRLTLRAPQGDVRFFGAVGDGSAGSDPLQSLSIVAGGNVTFDRDLTIDGPLTIAARGVVTFLDSVTLRNGGSLTITGAEQVFFGPASRITLLTGSAAQPGALLLEANEIDLRMGQELIVGAGAVTLRPALPGQSIALLNPAGISDTPAILSLDRTEMAAFADGFASFTVGWTAGGGTASAGSGAVNVGANPNVDGVAVPASLSVFGGSITVGDYSSRDAVLRLGSGDTLRLAATGDVTLANEIEADRLELLAAGGRIQSVDVNTDQRSSEPLRALDVVMQAQTGIQLARIEVQRLDAVNTGAGDIGLVVGAARATTRFDASVLDGSVDVLRLAQTAASGGNDIALATTAGGVALLGAADGGSGITISGDGTLALSALGAGSDLLLQAPVSVGSGAVSMTAADALSSNAAGRITASGAAAITLASGTGALTLQAPVSSAGGSLTLNSGAALDLSGVTLDAGAGGRIALQAVGDLTVGIVEASVSIALGSSAGALRDGLAGDGANLRGEAASATLAAAAGIGSGSAPLRTAVGSLEASNSASGGLFVAESTGLVVGAAGLSTAGSGGAIVVQTADGPLLVQGAVQAGASGAGAGHVLLSSQGASGQLTLAADVVSVVGSISLVASQALLVQGPAATVVRATAAGQTLDLRAGADLTMAPNASLFTQGGAVRVDAGGALTLGRVDAGQGGAVPGAVSLRAGNGIGSAAGAPAGAADIVASALRLQAGTGSVGAGTDALHIVASTLAAQAGGSLHLQAGTALAVASVPGATVQRVASDGSAATAAADAALAGLQAGGVLTLELTGGGLSLLAGGASAGSHLLFKAPGDLLLGSAVVAGGSASLLAGGRLDAQAAGDVTAGGSLDVQAGSAVALADGSELRTTAGGALRLEAGGAVTLGRIDAGSGGVAIVAGAALQGRASGAGPDIRGGTVLLQAAAVGEAGDALSLAATQLAAVARSGGLFIAEADTLQVLAQAAGSTVARVAASGLFEADAPQNPALAGLGSAAALVLGSGGALAIAADAPVQAAGALRLASTAGSLSLGGTVASAAGSISLLAGTDLRVQAAVTAGSGARSVDAEAGQDIVFEGAGAFGTDQGAIVLQAGRDVQLGRLDAGSAAVAVVAAGAVRDGDAAADISAAATLLRAGGAVAAVDDALDLGGGTLALQAGGGAWLAATAATTLGDVAVQAQRVAADGQAADGALLSGSGARTGGPLALVLDAGDLRVARAVATGGGPLLLQADGGSMTLGASVDSAGGDVLLRSAGLLELGAAASLRSAGGDITLQAAAAVAMDAASLVASGGGDIALRAGGLATVSQLDAGTGALTLEATALRGTAATAASAPHLTAASLVATLAASGSAPAGLGTVAQPVHTALGSLAANVSGAGGVFIAQRGELAVGALASGGALVLQAEGGVTGLGAIAAAGPLRLVAAGDTASLRLAGTVAVADGAATLQAGAALELAALTLTGAARSLDLQAGGRLVLGSGDGVVTQQGAVLARAGGELVVGRVDAGSAAVVLQGTRIVDGDAAGDAQVDIVAGSLSLTASGADAANSGIGAAGQALETRVATLSAAAGAGGLFIAEADGLAVGRTTATVQRVNADLSLTRVDAPAQEDLNVAGEGALVLQARTGDLRLGGGDATPGSALRAGTGSVLLQAEAGRLFVDAGLAGGGPVSLLAAGDLSFSATGGLRLDGGASADLASGANLSMADGAVVASAAPGGHLRLEAAGTMTLGLLQAGGNVSLSARSIADSGVSGLDVAAQALRLVTTAGGAGSAAAPLDTAVALLAAQVAGTGAAGLFVNEADSLRTGLVGPVVVQRVAADASTAPRVDAALADLASAGNVVLRAATGLELGDGDGNGRGLGAGGNVLLQTTLPDAPVVLEPGAALRLAGGHASLRAGGAVLLGADIVLERSGRNVDIEAGGDITQLAGTGIDTNQSAVRVAAGGDLVLARIGAGSGNVSLLAGGAIREALDGQGRGDDAPEIAAASARLVAGGGVGSAAERLELRVGALAVRAGDAIWLDEADGVRIGDVAVRVNRVGSDATASPLDDTTLSDLVTTGGAGGIALLTRAGDIDLQDGSAPADGRAVQAFGGAAVWLQPGGAGARLNVPGDSAVQQAGGFELASGLRLGGAFSIEAGLGGTAADGPILLAGPIDGSAGGAADVLTLRSDGASVTVLGAVGGTQPLDRVLVTGAGDVRFAEAVRVSGELRVQASGVVRFDGPLVLAGGSLVISGAREVLLGDVSLGSGDVEIGADLLQLRGTLASGGDNARLLLQPGSAGTALRVAEGAAPGALVLDSALLARLTGFERVSLAAPQGELVVDGATLAALAPVRALEVGSGGDLALSGATQLTQAGATLVAQAGGTLRMAAGSSVATTGGNLSLAADGDLLLGRVDTRGAGLAAGATLTLQAGGLLRELGSDSTTDLFAERLVLRGLGPLLGPGQSEAGAALDAQVLRVDIDQRAGVVLRDSGADGRTRFNVAVGDELHQPVVVVGVPLREAPQALPADAGAALRAAAVAQAPDAWRPLSALRQDGEGRAVRAGFSGAPVEADDGVAGQAAKAYLELLLSEAGDVAWSLPRLTDSPPPASLVHAGGGRTAEWWADWIPGL